MPKLRSLRKFCSRTNSSENEALRKVGRQSEQRTQPSLVRAIIQLEIKNMSIQVTANLSLQIPSGPNLQTNWSVPADAYDRATVTIPKSTTAGQPGTTVSLAPQPAGLPQPLKVLLLVITSSDYSGKVTYTFGGNSWKLNGPQVVAGPGLLKDLALGQTIVFDTQAVTTDVTVDVLALRTGLS
jgi:hypothetical protein